MSKLLNCPFCDSRNVKWKNTCGAHYVICEDCESYGPMIRNAESNKKQKEKAIAKWNTRYDHFATKSLHANSCSCHVVANVSDTTNHLAPGSPAP